MKWSIIQQLGVMIAFHLWLDWFFFNNLVNYYFNKSTNYFLCFYLSCDKCIENNRFCIIYWWSIFADNTTFGLRPVAIFVNINNTVYMTATSLNQIQVFFQGSITPTRTISSGLISSWSLFVTGDDIIYVNNSNNSRVDMWTSNTTMSNISLKSKST